MLFLSLLLCVCISVCILAIHVGSIEIPILEILTGSLSEQHKAVLLSIRIPRVLLSAFVGAALAVAGAALQGLFRNPLADPSLIGIVNGASLAVAFVIVLGGSFAGFLGIFSLSAAAFVGGLATSFLVFQIARLSGQLSVTYMLLAGIAITAITSASTGFLTYLSNDQQLRTFTFWTMGSVGGALWEDVIVSMVILLPAILYLNRRATQLNILLLGEDNARYIGVDSHRLKLEIVVCAALCVGASVAVSGIIGFIGLIVPHLIRLLVGSDHRLLIPASAFGGAILLVIADTVARMVIAPAELPIGVLTSLIGGPFFLWLLIKQPSDRGNT